jgi:hypothetical protein
VAVLEVFTWKCNQLVCHDLSDVVYSSKVRWNLNFGKRKKSHGLRSSDYGGCGTTEIPFLAKSSFTEMAV